MQQQLQQGGNAQPQQGGQQRRGRDADRAQDAKRGKAGDDKAALEFQQQREQLKQVSDKIGKVGLGVC